MIELDYRAFRAIADDFDGTLSETMGVHIESRIEAFQIYAQDQDDERFVQIPQPVHDEAHKHGHRSMHIISWVLKTAGISANIEQHAGAIREIKNDLYWDKAEQGLPAMPGAIEFVNRAELVWPGQQGIVTAAYWEREIHPFLSRYQLIDVFRRDLVITADNFQNPDGTIDEARQKPHPDPYNLLIERLGIRPPELLVLEDNSRGIQSARGAGATVMAIANTHSIEEIENFEPECRPYVIARDFDHARQLLGI